MKYNKEGRDIRLVTVIGGDVNELVGSQFLYEQNGKQLTTNKPFPLDLALPFYTEIEAGLCQVKHNNHLLELMIEPLSPPPTLLVLGSGHIAECLVSIGHLLCYEVIVVDDRPEFANPLKLPMADQIWCGSFSEMLPNVSLHSHCFAVLATRGHQTDAIALSYLINKQIPYIGMVGSKRKIRSIYTLLDKQGIHVSQHKNVYAPVGLDINSETPQEIALSILAEVQLIRYGGSGRTLSSMDQQPKVHSNDKQRNRPDLDLFRKMASAQEKNEPFAAITVIETAGHVPRGTGTRMMVSADGRIDGTIGGGRRESELIELSLKCLTEGEPHRATVHFSGTYDSFQPVCGGSFEFFIQPYGI